MEHRSWQVVDIPLDFLYGEPVQRISLESNLKGTIFLDDVRLITRAASPLSVSWEPEVADSIRSGSMLPIRAAIHIDSLDPDGGPPRLFADLSDLGGQAVIPLIGAADGVYQLDTVVVPAGSGIRDLRIRVEQRSASRFLEADLATSVFVVPAADEIILDDTLTANWQLRPLAQATVDMGETAIVFSGDRAMTVRADFFDIGFVPLVPIAPAGYTLRFAFHPGDANFRTSWFYVSINDRNSALNIMKTESGPLIDVDRKQWQVVDIPLHQLTDEPIKEVRLEGALSGTFYLDNIRLVAAHLSGATAVFEDPNTLTVASELGQNFPNPFNSSTAIQFSLPAAAHTRLQVYNLVGQRVVSLVDEVLFAGSHSVAWDGVDAAGLSVASGVYLYRLRTEDGMHTRKFLLLR